jgi:hypothetical protein
MRQWMQSLASHCTVRIDRACDAATLPGHTADCRPLVRVPAYYGFVRTGPRTDGTVTLSGQSSEKGREKRVQVVKELTVKTNGASGLEGLIRFGKRWPCSCPDRTITHEYQFSAGIMAAAWQSDVGSPIVAPGPYHGVWRGILKRTSCSGECRLVPSEDGFRLDISQVGSKLSATLEWTELEGTSSRSSIVLTRHYVASSCPARASYDQEVICNESVTFSGSIDAMGSMRGTVEWHRDGVHYTYGRFDWTASFELKAEQYESPDW